MFKLLACTVLLEVEITAVYSIILQSRLICKNFIQVIACFSTCNNTVFMKCVAVDNYLQKKGGKVKG